MASFSAEVKDELLHVPIEKECCRQAALTALFRMGATISLGSNRNFGITFASNTAAVTRKTFALLKAEDADLPIKTSVARANRLKKRNSYIVKIEKSLAAFNLLEKLGFIKDGQLNMADDHGILRKECCRRAYLMGAFLGGGSVNRPEAHYHLEIANADRKTAQCILQTLRKMEFPAGMYERKDDFVVYIKEGDSVIDFFAMIKADNSVEKFEVARNIKEVRGQVNRIVNCETANVQKAVNAAGNQLAAIKKITAAGLMGGLSADLKETAAARSKPLGACGDVVYQQIGAKSPYAKINGVKPQFIKNQRRIKTHIFAIK